VHRRSLCNQELLIQDMSKLNKLQALLLGLGLTSAACASAADVQVSVPNAVSPMCPNGPVIPHSDHAARAVLIR
jgi:hypothetical protein